MEGRLSAKRALAAAEAFFRAARMTTGAIPERITTAGHDAYPRALRHVFGAQVAQRTNRYLTNHVEQDHRGITRRYRSRYGFKTFGTAAGFCRLFDESRAFFRPQSQRQQALTLGQCQPISQERFAPLMGLMAAAYPEAYELTNGP